MATRVKKILEKLHAVSELGEEHILAARVWCFCCWVFKDILAKRLAWERSFWLTLDRTNFGEWFSSFSLGDGNVGGGDIQSHKKGVWEDIFWKVTKRVMRDVCGRSKLARESTEHCFLKENQKNIKGEQDMRGVFT